MTKSRVTTPRRELVREEFLTKAAEVFERKGFSPTRISDVAEALALSRSALYHYFKSKDEILQALVEEHTEQAAESMERVVRNHAGSPANKLRALLTTIILIRMSGGARIRVLDQLAAEMPPKIKTHFERARRRIFALVTTVIQEGVDSGDFRSVDPRTAALAVIGIAVWTSWWYSPSGRQTPQELAEVLVDIAIDGLSRQSDDPRKADTLQEVINSIRRQLAHLEKLVIDLSEGTPKKQVMAADD